MNTVTDTIREIARDAIRELPFDADYRSINKLRFLMQQHQLLINEINSIKAEMSIKSPTTTDGQLQELIACFRSFEEAMKLYEETDDPSDEQMEEYVKSQNDYELRLGSDSLDSDQETPTEKIDPNAIKQLSDLEQNLERLRKELEDQKKYFSDIFKTRRNTPWQQAIYKRYEESCDNTSAEDFTNFVITTSGSYLPDKYSSEALGQFPCGAHNLHPSGLAHFQPYQGIEVTASENEAGLFASIAPKIFGRAAIGGEYDASFSQHFQFLDMLFEKDVQSILELGGNQQGRVDYRGKKKNRTETDPNQCGKYTAEFDSESNCITLTNTDTMHSKTIFHARIGTADQAPLKLSNEDLSNVLRCYNHYTQGAILIHCDAGVGRTGQMRLLFSMLDSLDHHPEIKTQIKKLIDVLVKKPATEAICDDVELKQLITTLKDMMIIKLSWLRQTRYAVETEKQFTSSFAQLMLLLAAQMRYTPEELDVLRQAIMDEPTAQQVSVTSNTGFGDNVARDDFSEFTVVCDGNTSGDESDLEREEALALGTNTAEKSALPDILVTAAAVRNDQPFSEGCDLFAQQGLIHSAIRSGLFNQKQHPTISLIAGKTDPSSSETVQANMIGENKQGLQPPKTARPPEATRPASAAPRRL